MGVTTDFLSREAGFSATPIPIIRKSQEYANLDILRAWAVLLVLFGHLSFFYGLVVIGPLDLMSMGSLGVQIFFVHTCLVLLLSLERQWNDQNGKTLFWSFMIRRVFRIYPLSMAVIALVAVFHLPQATIGPGHFYGTIADGGDILSNVFLVQNLTHRISILGPLWSLPFEIQMYLSFPLLFLAVRANRTIWNSMLIWALGIAGAFILRHNNPNNSLILFAPCFLPGIIAYQLLGKMRQRLPGFVWPLAVVVLTTLFMLRNGGPDDWPKRWLMCLLLGLAIPVFSQSSAKWLVGPCHIVAKYSYGIYLTHFFCIWFALECLASWPKEDRIAAFVVLLIALPLFFYHVIEKPMIRMGKSIAGRYVQESV